MIVKECRLVGIVILGATHLGLRAGLLVGDFLVECRELVALSFLGCRTSVRLAEKGKAVCLRSGGVLFFAGVCFFGEGRYVFVWSCDLFT